MLRITLLVLLAAACASPPAPSPGASPTPPAAEDDAVAGLLGDLAAAGSTVHTLGAFDASPLAPEGLRICVDGQPVHLYLFPTVAAAAARAAMIDPRDPSNVGAAMITWAGNPKFWLRGQMLVLYLGNDAELTERLVMLLGDPFASGQGRPPLPGEDAC